MSDLIERQAAIETAVEAADEWDGGYSRSREEIITMKLRMLPSAQPERKKGCKIVKGTGTYGYCACDQCGKPVHPEDKFCSNCGADFREEDT